MADLVCVPPGSEDDGEAVPVGLPEAGQPVGERGVVLHRHVHQDLGTGRGNLSPGSKISQSSYSVLS